LGLRSRQGGRFVVNLRRLGTASAKARWTALAYAEKARPQFLSLRQIARVQPGHIGNTAYLRHR
jgi:hypothetical protein